MRSINRPPPGDTMSNRKSQQQPSMAKRRSIFYESEFAVDREVDPAKDRVRNDAIVLAELRTNVIVCLPRCGTIVFTYNDCTDTRRVQLHNRSVIPAVKPVPKVHVFHCH